MLSCLQTHVTQMNWIQSFSWESRILRHHCRLGLRGLLALVNAAPGVSFHIFKTWKAADPVRAPGLCQGGCVYGASMKDGHREAVKTPAPAGGQIAGHLNANTATAGGIRSCDVLRAPAWGSPRCCCCYFVLLYLTLSSFRY